MLNLYEGDVYWLKLIFIFHSEVLNDHISLYFSSLHTVMCNYKSR